MASRAFVSAWASVALLACCGCATMKHSDTARTGVEQLLISSAADQALDKVDLRPIVGAKVFIDEKYLDCVDKNYVLVGAHQRLLRANCTIVDKAEDADVIIELASGGVGTDRTDLLFGVPEIPMPPPSPISIPKLAIFERVRAMGTAKLAVVAYDAKTKAPVINSGYTLARADYMNWNVLGLGGMPSGTVHEELAMATGQKEQFVAVPTVSKFSLWPKRPPSGVTQATHQEPAPQ